MKVLIIEDDILVRKALSHVLLEAGHTVIVSPDGMDALKVIEKNAALDLVICDVMMPFLTGPSFILKLQQMFPHRLPYIIIISGDKVGEDFLKKIEIPYDQFLTKPIDHERLREILLKMQGDSGS
jgi:CheY-like chemotaxis protein